jgi:hypothetical protein
MHMSLLVITSFLVGATAFTPAVTHTAGLLSTTTSNQLQWGHLCSRIFLVAERKITQGQQTDPPSDATLKLPVERKVYSTKAEIVPIYNLIDDYNPFELIEDDVCLDPHDEDNNFLYENFRAKNGARLNRSIATEEFILVGNDKSGISSVLDIPVPPGASLSVKMSTWCNPCHSGFRVENSQNFGVGMVPYGEGKVQKWIRGNTDTCIENGIQIRADIGNIFYIIYSYKVMQQGSTLEYFNNKEVQLDIIDVRISYDSDNGEFEFSFVQADDKFKIKCPAKEDNKYMQLYFNCLGWADNNTYIQIHEIVYEPPTIMTSITTTDEMAVSSTNGNIKITKTTSTKDNKKIGTSSKKVAKSKSTKGNKTITKTTSTKDKKKIGTSTMKIAKSKSAKGNKTITKTASTKDKKKIGTSTMKIAKSKSTKGHKTIAKTTSTKDNKQIGTSSTKVANSKSTKGHKTITKTTSTSTKDNKKIGTSSTKVAKSKSTKGNKTIAKTISTKDNKKIGTSSTNDAKSKRTKGNKAIAKTTSTNKPIAKTTSSEVDKKIAKNKSAKGNKKKRDTVEVKDIIPDYNKIVKADPELHPKVIAMINMHYAEQNLNTSLARF